MRVATGSRGTTQRARAQLVILGCLTAIGATLFTVAFFDILTPPLDTATLLNPPLARPTAVLPTPTVLPPTPHLLLADNFSTRSNWPSVSADASYGYSPNGYLLAPPADADFTHVFLQNFDNNTYRDLSLQTEASAVSGSSGVNYGVFFWHSQDKLGQERFLYFGVNSEGRYTLRAYFPIDKTTAVPSPSHWAELVPETASPSIKRNADPNLLRVNVHPHRILGFINGSLVFDRNDLDVEAYRDRDDFDGRVGLMAFSTGEGHSKVIFTLFDLYVDLEK